jgi:RecA-family ATPase
MAIDIMSAFRVKPPPLDFVFGGLVAGTVACIAAAGSTGKSFLALQLAMCVASAEADKALLKLGIKNHGKVVILNAEDPEIVVLQRLHSIGLLLSEDARMEVAERVVIEPLVGKGVDIMKKEWFEAVLRITDDARLAIFDTFSRWHRKKENDNGEMAGVVGQFERLSATTGAASLYLHHVSKGMAMDGRQDEQQATRGAAAITDNCRWQGYMQKMTVEEAKTFGVDELQRKDFVSWGGNKENYGQASNVSWLRRHEGGVLLPTTFENTNTKKKAWK